MATRTGKRSAPFPANPHFGDGPREALRGKPVGAVVSALQVLRFVSRQAGPVNLTRVIRELGINPSTCFNIMRTLVREGMLRFDPGRKTYGLGLGALELAKGAAILGQDIGLVRPMMEEVAAKHEVTVTLWRRISRDRMVVVLAVVAPGIFRVHMDVGQRLPLLLGSGGRVMAAYSELTPAEMRAQFSQLRWSRPMSFRAYMAQVAQVRERGWSTDAGDFVSDVASLSVPVFDGRGRFAFACGATMFVTRYDDRLGRRVAADLAAASRAMSQLLPGE